LFAHTSVHTTQRITVAAAHTISTKSMGIFLSAIHQVVPAVGAGAWGADDGRDRGSWEDKSTGNLAERRYGPISTSMNWVTSVAFADRAQNRPHSTDVTILTRTEIQP
jgi:hypothetical protein